MVMLVSLAQASQHLRRDTDADDADLTLKIQAASRAVLNYISPMIPGFIDSNGDFEEDSAGEVLGVPDDIKAATLLLIGEFYMNREPKAADSVPAEYGYGYMSRAVVALLYHYRKPTLA
jgi:hypothetical protein